MQDLHKNRGISNILGGSYMQVLHQKSRDIQHFERELHAGSVPKFAGYPIVCAGYPIIGAGYAPISREEQAGSIL